MYFSNKFYVLFFLFISGLISGCSDAPLFGSEDAGIEGVVTNQSNIVIRSKIPAQIPLTSSSDMQNLTIRKSLVMGNSNEPIVYFGYGGDLIGRFYLVEGTDSVFLDVLDELFIYKWPVMSGDGSIVVYRKSGDIYTINLQTKVSHQIAASLTMSIGEMSITDDGSLVAFISDNDLTGKNPSNFNQIFTLTTDGSDILTQVSTFTGEYFSTTYKRLRISGNGSTIFFQSTDDVIGDSGNADGSTEIFSINSDGANLTQLTNLNLTQYTYANVSLRSDTTGEHLIFNIAGELYTHNTVTNSTTFIKHLIPKGQHPESVYNLHTISADGSRIFYVQGHVLNASEYEFILFSNRPDGADEVAQFTTEILSKTNKAETYASTPNMFSLHSSTDGADVTFMSKYDFGATSLDDNNIQIYTLTR